MNYKKKSRNFSKNRGRSMNRILVVEDDPQLQLLYRSGVGTSGLFSHHRTEWRGCAEKN
jgi:two-component system, OmpR family, response regulator